MSKKAFFIILGLSVVVTYGVAIADFMFNITKGKIGIPLGFSSVSLFGSSTDYTRFFLDIAFWFIFILVTRMILKQLLKKK